MFSLKTVGKEIRKASKKRPADVFDDPRNVKSVCLLNGMEVIVEQFVETDRHTPEMSSAPRGIQFPGTNEIGIGIKSQMRSGEMDWARDVEMGYEGEEFWNSHEENEPVPDTGENDAETAEEEDLGRAMRSAALSAMYEEEVPITGWEVCLDEKCGRKGEYECLDCHFPGLLCVDCLIKKHQFMPCHRPRKWTGEFFQLSSLSQLGAIFALGHKGAVCPHVYSEQGPQNLTFVDINGIHEVKVGWCRCAGAPTTAQQLFARTTPWDFVGTMGRLTDMLDPKSHADVYKPFNYVQRQWRVVRAWKRGGIRRWDQPRIKGSLAFGYKHPDSALIHTLFIGGDGNFRLWRNNKGGGEKTDPSLFGDDAFYAPNTEYREFCRVRGGAPDDMSVGDNAVKG
ncbi:hypothetical protein M422DRAFT_265964 [Sphaerobolus stellatus SS14]|uniref:CxC2-like cysteine cluster KDZ transposase-associated domain-containing protein n=1 Tax=Sphaerobolus stellatus (strain SS14) TaxID=990650 RepID=A0A0C9V4D3_SPHS4|nr:hypothetical protein M422DRAFT_265964 [Sphaerobolus stellatus SS14]